MPNLSDYYADLLTWEGHSPTELVHSWPTQLCQAIEEDFVLAVASSELKGSNCPIRDRSSNQSIGNQVEVFTITKLEVAMSQFTIAPCSGAGFPDKTLIERATSMKMPLEMKATSDWNPRDSNRRVLTSSSQKLRVLFTAPIHHLLLTVHYSPSSLHATIDAIRLDFLEPSTTVNVRLEASVNHKILARGTHHSRVI